MRIRKDLALQRKRLILLFLVLVFSPLHSYSGDTKISENVVGIWYQPYETEPESFEWNAQWIWLDESLGLDVLLARKSFQLNEVHKNSILRITATSNYQLYVNGEYVCRGPARCAGSLRR